ncbi:MAG: glycosyltransferase 87 family protein [Solirubrobacteraceae bacterium]
MPIGGQHERLSGLPVTSLTGMSRRIGSELGPAAAVGCLGLALVIAWWVVRALHDPAPYDTGLAYHAGQAAWSSGHPEHVGSWDGTPLLAAVMAVLSRVLSPRLTADGVVVLSATLWVGVVVIALGRLRSRLRRQWLWIAAAALLTFGPLMSTVWTKQFNAISLVAAIGGFELVRKGRPGLGAAAIGFSVAFKPLLILLGLVMLARRETRKAGALAIAWTAGLSLASLGLLALRAHDFGVLNPITALTNFNHRSVLSPFTCVPYNYSPAATLCRLIGYWPASLSAVERLSSLPGVYSHATLQRVVVLIMVGLLGAWVATALKGRRAGSWELFAFTCALSVMVSPLAWSHYQLMLAPLLLLLWVRFVTEGAGLGSWGGLIVGFALASLMWAPYGSLWGGISSLFAAKATAVTEPILVDDFAQFAQYILVVTGIWWYAQRHWRDAHSGAKAL